MFQTTNFMSFILFLFILNYHYPKLHLSQTDTISKWYCLKLILSQSNFVTNYHYLELSSYHITTVTYVLSLYHSTAVSNYLHESAIILYYLYYETNFVPNYFCIKQPLSISNFISNYHFLKLPLLQTTIIANWHFLELSLSKTIIVLNYLQKNHYFKLPLF